MTKSAREEIQELASHIMHKQVEPIVGCRAIVSRMGNFGAPVVNHPAFLIIRGIESETDEFPVGEVRNQWDQSVLKSLDLKLAEYLESVSQQLKEACAQLSAGVPWTDF